MSGFTPAARCTLAALFTLLLSACQGEISVQVVSPSAGQETTGRVVFLAGPDSHGPGEHEHRAGSELLARALRDRRPDLETVNIYGGWPEDESIFSSASAVVLYCDGGRGHLINKHLESFASLLERGVGIVALHYCVELPKDSPSADAMLRATGGYFETWWSVNPHWTAHFRELPQHPISTNIRPFVLRDEWYFNMRFAGNGVTPILSAVPPLETMERRNGPHSGNDAVREMVARGDAQVTAWAFERDNGGRGFGYTGGHFHANWQNDHARELVLNAIEWVAGDR